MLIQVANIVDNACQILVRCRENDFPDKGKFRLHALLCLEAVSGIGVGFPVQYMEVIFVESKGDDDCARIARSILEKQR